MPDVPGTLRLRNVALRNVAESDAEAIVALRRAAESRGFLSPTAGVEQQRAWLEQYQDRHRRGLEHYFMICTRSNETLGTVRVYDVQTDACEWGSWVVRTGAPPAIAWESYLLVNHFIFECLLLRVARIRVRKANRSVARFHRAMRSRQTGESENEMMFEVNDEWYAALRARHPRCFDLMAESRRRTTERA